MAAVTLTTSGLHAVTYEERPDCSESWTPEGVEVVRICAPSWDNRYRFATDFLGWVSPTPDPNTNRLVRHLPDQHPTYPKLYCVSVTLLDKQGVPNQDATGRLTFDQRDAAGAVQAAGSGDGTGYAVYRCSYRRLLYTIKSDADTTDELDRYVTREYAFNTESLTVPGQTYRFGILGDTGTPAGTAIPADVADGAIPGDMAKRFGTMVAKYTWHRLPYPPTSAIQAAIGCVNSATFDTYWPAQTLYMPPPEVRQMVGPLGEVEYECRYSFIYRPDGWNKLYKRGATVSDFFKVVERTDATKGIYETYDFANLFKLT